MVPHARGIPGGQLGKAQGAGLFLRMEERRKSSKGTACSTASRAGLSGRCPAGVKPGNGGEWIRAERKGQEGVLQDAHPGGSGHQAHAGLWPDRHETRGCGAAAGCAGRGAFHAGAGCRDGAECRAGGQGRKADWPQADPDGPPAVRERRREDSGGDRWGRPRGRRAPRGSGRGRHDWCRVCALGRGAWGRWASG